MVDSSKASSLPLLREELKSLADCTNIYLRDEDGYLAEALTDAVKNSSSPSMPKAELSQRAVHACGNALWSAIHDYNKFRRDRGVLGGLPTPDYEVIPPTFRPSEAVEESEMSEHNTLSDETTDVGSIKLAARLRRSRTQSGKLDVLVKEADAIAKRIEHFAQGFDFAERMGILDLALQGYKVDAESDRAKARTELVQGVARVRGDRSMRDIHALLKTLSAFRDLGGNPGYIFQRSFVQSLIQFWTTLAGATPKRDDRAFVSFVQAAYLVASESQFDSWENVLVTALKDYHKLQSGMSRPVKKRTV